MGVYIKGMEMPTEQYGKMVITLYPNGHVAEYVGDIGRVWEAVPVPPHGRLGDLDALIDKVIAKYLKFEREGKLVFAAAEIKQDICDLISDAPTIIQEEKGE